MRHTADTIMLFAAGFGTRMGALTQTRPKPLLPVAGKPLLDHTLELAQAITPRQIVVNAHYHADQITAHLANTPVSVSIETPEILETGGGLRQALPLLGDSPVFTSNTDAIWRGPNPFALLQEAWKPDEMDALLLCLPRANALGYTRDGDFLMDADGRLTRGPGVVYSGIQILKTEGLHAIADTAFSLNLLWDQMRETKRLFGITYPGEWCDVGTPEGLALAETLLESPDV
ncbi:nucleotidyltransferase family protein [Shimia sp. R11_0]|uniref:nucleotidyltransferase family protein n=1 Tax=Shimia sp. R11_0 TaxID=2821096 RepID=UPI001ADBF70D|nr:nucleotidyltransferase family protein [Shimia sp. R11_0]MBO9476172.1 nucleotidyltransferase family protein [Shimia sp. R11_0]